jgi:hypothetical protein
VPASSAMRAARLDHRCSGRPRSPPTGRLAATPAGPVGASSGGAIHSGPTRGGMNVVMAPRMGEQPWKRLGAATKKPPNPTAFSVELSRSVTGLSEEPAADFEQPTIAEGSQHAARRACRRRGRVGT